MVTMERELTDEQIAVRAYEISESLDRGSDEENWCRAERELLARATAAPPAAPRRRLTARKSTDKPSPSRARKPRSADGGPAAAEG